MAESFRIVVLGQAAFGESVVNALVEAGEDIAGVFCAPDREGAPPDPIKTAAEAHGIQVFQFRRMRDADALDAFKALNADLCVMAFVTDIVPLEMIEAPRLGTIQYHPSLLPKHRGPSSINWPIIEGKTRTGLSIFWPDEGLDTGPILMQKEVDITPDDTLGTVYFGKLFPLGVEAMVESVQLVKAGDPPRIEQDHSQMTYESWCTPEEVVIDWSQPVGTVYNMIRGADPSPGANSTMKGGRVKFFKASRSETDTGDAEAGTIIAIDETSFTVACDGGAIQIARVQPDGSKKLAASDWARDSEIAVGDRFGS